MSNISNPTIREFDEGDWMGFAGAEKFPDGKEPLIVNPEDSPYLLIADGQSVCLNFFNPEQGGDDHCWTLEKKFATQDAARKFIEGGIAFMGWNGVVSFIKRNGEEVF